MITFDDGYKNFSTAAWRILQWYGFPAIVSVVTDAVGYRAEWDSQFGEPAELLSWEEICKLQEEGVTFFSHSATHSSLIGLSFKDAVHEGLKAKRTLEAHLGEPCQGIVYPFGDCDWGVKRAFRAIGYRWGLTAEPRFSDLRDDPLGLPRIEVEGADDLDEFARKLGHTTSLNKSYVLLKRLNNRLHHLL